LSAANEVIVDGFLKGRVRWVDISDVLEATLQRWPGTIATDVEVVLDVDRQARGVAAELIEQRVHA
jgi:1-deoxy-D-xylulose-5-phosphate reductoisomerase